MDGFVVCSAMSPKRFPAIVALMVALTVSAAARPRIVRPFERSVAFAPSNRVDELVLARLRNHGIEPAYLCSDQVFVRRVYLDVIGTLPTPREAGRFLSDRRLDKRPALIEDLLTRKEFADYWAMKWCDLLRVKAEYPINLWPNAVQAYHRWVHQSIREGKTYDRFARELLTSSGSNFRVPPVNFYRALQSREPSAIARAAALTFMGTRLDTWSEARRGDIEAFFSRVAYKGTAEWKEEIVCLDPAPTEASGAMFPDGVSVDIRPEEDPRQVFADWLIRPGNRWFARNAANRVWSWLMGRGIIHEPDDIRPDNPPANPELLAFLEGELVNAGYDLRHLFRLVLNSRTYQQSSISRSEHPDAEAFSAHYPVRRLEAEVLADALAQLFGAGEGYSSVIPEPFTFIPDAQRTIQLADGSITSQFLEMFGRPARDTGLESERSNLPTDAQRLYLLNSTAIQRRIESRQWLGRLLGSTKGRVRPLVRSIYLTIMSRYPTPAEMTTAAEYFRARGMRPRQGAADLSWALVNTKEFLYRH